MAMDEREQLKDQTEEAGSQPNPAPAEQEEENSSRLDAAKAFFRALHAGGDAPPASPNHGSSAEPVSARSSGPCPSCQRLEVQVGEAEQKAEEAESLYKRMAADFENYRRRIDREREEFQAAGVQKAVETLLPALDDMDRAQANLKADMQPEKLIESLTLVFNRITRCFEQMGIKTLSVVGEHFDPKYHEPVQEIETTEFPDGSVIQELRRGYTLNERVIRPALVNVAANAGGVQAASQGESHDKEPEETGGNDEAQAEGGESKVYDLSEFAERENQSEGQSEPSGQPAENV